MIKIQEAENQIITDYEVYDRRPNDSDLLIAAIAIPEARLGRTPSPVAAHAAFYSAKNEAGAKARGVKRICIPNLNREPRAPARTKEALVPQWSEMADGMRGPDQRRETATWPGSLPIQGLTGNAPLGRRSASSPTTWSISAAPWRGLPAHSSHNFRSEPDWSPARAPSSFGPWLSSPRASISRREVV